MMSVGVLGAGAIGVYTGVQLFSGNKHVPGFRVTLVGRQALLKAVIATHGIITVRDVHGRESSVKATVVASGDAVPAASDEAMLLVTTDVAHLADAEVVIVSVKSAQTEMAVKELLATLAPDAGPLSAPDVGADVEANLVADDEASLVADDEVSSTKTKPTTEEPPAKAGRAAKKTLVSLQNGVRNPALMRAVVEAEAGAEALVYSVLAGMVGFNVVWSDNATFAQSTDGGIYLERGGRTSATAVLLARQLARGGVNVVVKQDIEPIQYGKLVLNLTNAVNALTGVPIVDMLHDPKSRQCVRMCMNEAIDVFQGARIRLKTPKATVRTLPRVLALPDCLFRPVSNMLIKIDRAAKSSMLQDLEKLKATEIDYLNGEVLRVAAENGAPEPRFNAKIIDLIRRAEAAGKGSPFMDGAAILAELRA